MQITISVNDKKLIITGTSKVDGVIEKVIENHDVNTQVIVKAIVDAVEEVFEKKGE